MRDGTRPGSVVGIVAIGRNEGERLRRCLDSATRLAACVVYVDSGSSDGSVAMARAKGVEVVELDLTIPFTAARARNEGFKRLRVLAPDLRYVQFVDGDCELADGWLEKAVNFLNSHQDVAIVCGRRRERFPERSIYNKLCDIEWDTPVGEALACGGDALVRADAFETVSGFRASLMAGEEPELCIRLRAAGWRIWRLGEEMTLHDAAMTRFSQWWRRGLRGGYGFAQLLELHGRLAEMRWTQSLLSVWFWGLGIPVAVSGFVLWWGPWALVLLLIYPLQVVRIVLRDGRSARENWWFAGFAMLWKVPVMFGQMKFLLHRYLGGRSRLIEYK